MLGDRFSSQPSTAFSETNKLKKVKNNNNKLKYKAGRSLQKEDLKKYKETAEKIFKFYLDSYKIIFWGVNAPFYFLRENMAKLIKNKTLNNKLISVDTNELKKKFTYHDDIFLSPDELFKYLDTSSQKHLFVILIFRRKQQNMQPIPFVSI